MKNYLILFMRVVVAGILLQTLFFKFTGAPESVFIFSTLGVEPWGRIFTGVVELIASALILIPRTQVLGAITAMGLMFGAIMSHVLFLGVVVQDDGGLLFALASVVFVLSSILVFILKNEVISMINNYKTLLPRKV